MVTNNTTIEMKNINVSQTTVVDNGEKVSENQQKKDVDIVKVMEESAVEVAFSMGAQIILAMMEAMQTVKDNAVGQRTVLDFLSGKVVSEDFNLANTGYEGKPITELSTDEAKALVEGNGFFSINSTSDRVSSFVIGMAGDNLENLEKAKEGIVQGFKEAEELWGGELPEISYKTQARTLELIDAKIAELKGEDKTTGNLENESTLEKKEVDITV